MSQTGQTGQRTYTEFAVGWLKEGKKGEYISSVANGERQTVKLLVEDENGNVVPLSNFAVFFNSGKKNPKAPDVSFVYSTDQ